MLCSVCQKHEKLLVKPFYSQIKHNNHIQSLGLWSVKSQVRFHSSAASK